MEQGADNSERTGAALKTGLITGAGIFAIDAIQNGWRRFVGGDKGRSFMSGGTWKWALGAGLAVGAINFLFRDHISERNEAKREARAEFMAGMQGAPDAQAESTRFRDMINAERAAQQQGVGNGRG